MGKKSIRQVIRKMLVIDCVKCPEGTKCVHDLEKRNKYCLLNLYKGGTKPGSLEFGPMINLRKPGELDDWYHFKIIKKFENRQEAEEYSKKNKIEIVEGFVD